MTRSPVPNAKIDPASRAIIAELLATDPDLRAIAREFLVNALHDLISLQRRGDPAVRARLAQSLAGPIVSAITEPVDEDAFGSLRAEMLEMMEEVRGAIMPEHREMTAEESAALAAPPPVLVPKSL